MPSKNRIKIYVENSYYHIYNRGVAKQIIFTNEKDYKVFLSYLKEALKERPKEKEKIPFTLQGRSFKGVPRLPKNFFKEVDLVAYCLMPNHFHLLIKQGSRNSMESFMRSVITRYSTYFNKKYDRVGPLFQGRYKAVLIDNDDYLLNLSRYIHRNPLELKINLIDAYSSYADYLALRNTDWIKPGIVLDFFNKKVAPEFTKVNSYQKFAEDEDITGRPLPEDLTID